jgi:hypothetical protein
MGQETGLRMSFGDTTSVQTILHKAASSLSPFVKGFLQPKCYVATRRR